MRYVVSAIMALLLSAGVASAQTTLPPPSTPSDIQSVAEVPVIHASVMMQAAFTRAQSPMVVLSQTDPRWRSLHLGRKTIGAAGCLLVNMVQIALENGFGTDPGEILQKLISPRFIMKNGNLKTGMLDVIFPGIRIIERFPVQRDEDLSGTISARLGEGYSVLLKLAHGQESHWIRAVGVAQSGDIEITDPAGGKIGTLATLYSPAAVREMLVIGNNNQG